jgi:hypothetical protein
MLLIPVVVDAVKAFIVVARVVYALTGKKEWEKNERWSLEEGEMD